MATYSYREVTTTQCEWLVPAAEPWGACWVEVMKAIHAATEQLKEAGLLKDGEEPSDDQIRIRPGDDEIIVYIERTEAMMEGK